jgi:hypothetical protein
MANYLYRVLRVPVGTTPKKRYFLRHKEAVDAAKDQAKLNLVVLVTRHTVEPWGGTRTGWLHRCLEGGPEQFLDSGITLEAWGPHPEKPGKIKRQDLRGTPDHITWDGTWFEGAGRRKR